MDQIDVPEAPELNVTFVPHVVVVEDDPSISSLLMYNFEASEAIEMLKESGLWMEKWSLDVKRSLDVRKSVSSSFSCPLPYSGLCNESNCRALRQNNGLYTQCKMVKKMGDYCKTCSN